MEANIGTSAADRTMIVSRKSSCVTELQAKPTTFLKGNFFLLVSYIFSRFFVVYGRKVNLGPATPSWPGEVYTFHLSASDVPFLRGCGGGRICSFLALQTEQILIQGEESSMLRLTNSRLSTPLIIGVMLP